jgi:hypothetical protein
MYDNLSTLADFIGSRKIPVGGREREDDLVEPGRLGTGQRGRQEREQSGVHAVRERVPPGTTRIR